LRFLHVPVGVCFRNKAPFAGGGRGVIQVDSYRAAEAGSTVRPCQKYTEMIYDRDIKQPVGLHLQVCIPSSGLYTGWRSNEIGSFISDQGMVAMLGGKGSRPNPFCECQCAIVGLRTTLCPKKVSPLNILQQPPQTCTDLNEILHTQDDIYFCHRRQSS